MTLKRQPMQDMYTSRYIAWYNSDVRPGTLESDGSFDTPEAAADSVHCRGLDLAYIEEVRCYPTAEGSLPA